MTASQRFRHSPSVRWIHWLTVGFVAMAYVTSEWADDTGTGGAQLHVLSGLALLLLFVPHLLARWTGRRAQAGDAGHRALAAGLVQLALLLFVVVQPVLGVLTVWAEGDALPLPFTPWQVAPLVRLDETWGDTLEDLHETVGNVFYAVIAVHALAALWHQFVLRDGVLRRMW
jgi:superoxide oxidase